MWLHVAIAALKNNLSRELRAVEAGEEVEVTDRSRVIARIVPAPATTSQRQEPLRIRPAKRPFAEVRDRRFPPRDPGVDSLALLLEERGDR